MTKNKLKLFWMAVYTLTGMVTAGIVGLSLRLTEPNPPVGPIMPGDKLALIGIAACYLGVEIVYMLLAAKDYTVANKTKKKA